MLGARRLLTCSSWRSPSFPPRPCLPIVPSVRAHPLLCEQTFQGPRAAAAFFCEASVFNSCADASRRQWGNDCSESSDIARGQMSYCNWLFRVLSFCMHGIKCANSEFCLLLIVTITITITTTTTTTIIIIIIITIIIIIIIINLQVCNRVGSIFGRETVAPCRGSRASSWLPRT